MKIGTKHAVIAATIIAAEPSFAQEAAHLEREYQGFIAAELVFHAGPKNADAPRDELKAIFDHTVQAANRREFLELSAELNAYYRPGVPLAFDRIYDKPGSSAERFSLYVAIDAGRGVSLAIIESELHDFVGSLHLPDAAGVDIRPTYYLLACGQATPLTSQQIN